MSEPLRGVDIMGKPANASQSSPAERKSAVKPPALKFPDLKLKVCNRCCLQEDHPEFGPVCEDGEYRGPHRLRRQRLWMAVVATELYDTRSAASASRVFGELCWDAESYVLVREFSDQEVAGLEDGSLTLTLEAVPAQIREISEPSNQGTTACQEVAK